MPKRWQRATGHGQIGVLAPSSDPPKHQRWVHWARTLNSAMHRLPFHATPLSVGVSIEPPALVEDTCRILIHIRCRPQSSCVSSSHLLLLVRSPPSKFRPCLLIANAWPHPFRTTRAASSTVDLSFDFVFSHVVSMCIHMRCVIRAGE